MIHKVIYDQATFGITSKSLQMLRNAIVDNLHDEIIVVEVPTNDICCGFVLLNKTTNTATWSGDGFRNDRGGEGGRGYKVALQLMDIFGIQHTGLATEEALNAFNNAFLLYTSEENLDKSLLNACNQAAEEFEENEYKCVYETAPRY